MMLRLVSCFPAKASFLLFQVMATVLPVTVKEFSKHLSKLFELYRLPRGGVGMKTFRILLTQGMSVSGGVDSMALCVLMRKHVELEGWPEYMVAYTLDHGVRAESAEEAQQVGEWIKCMGMTFEDPELNGKVSTIELRNYRILSRGLQDASYPAISKNCCATRDFVFLNNLRNKILSR